MLRATMHGMLLGLSCRSAQKIHEHRSLGRTVLSEFGRRPSRKMSGRDTAALFGGETAILYAKIFEQHKHPDGPWTVMMRAVEQAVGPYLNGNLLDVASGPGEPAISIAGAFPQMNVMCTDVAQDMLDKAQARGKELKNIEFKLVDAQDMSAFADGAFDVVTCCYGYMFCEEPVKAFQEAKRVLKPGGTLVTTYWRQLNMMNVARAAMEVVLDGGPVPPPPIDPLSLSEPGLVERFLSEAGFDLTTVTVVESQYPFELGEPETARKLALLPVWPMLLEMAEKQQSKNLLDVAMSAADQFFSDNKWVNADGSVTCPANRFAMAVARK